MVKALQLVRRDFFTTLPFWDKLDGAEKLSVEAHTRGLAVCMADAKQTRHEIGGHLAAIHAVLEGKRLYRRYLRTLNIGWRTAERYRQCYGIACANLSPTVLRLAAARGMDLVGFQPKRPFGPYTEVIRRLPVPKAELAIPGWLEKVEAARRAYSAKKGHSGTGLPADARMRLVYRCAAGQHRAVYDGVSPTVARKWGLKLLAVLMTEFGLTAQRIEPAGLPEGFKAVLGRPRKR